MEASILENGIPNILPVNGHDRYNYLVKYAGSNTQLQAVVLFDRNLDEDIMKKAVRLSLDAEPVLGCRFIEDEKRPYWQRFEEPDEIPWFEFIQGDNEQETVEHFLKCPFALAGQQVNVRLIRAEGGDTLCIKICHACSDAKGLKEYLQLLAGIYSRLEEDSGFQPVPNKGRRDQKHYFDALGIEEPLALFDPQAPFMPSTWAFPYHSYEIKEMRISMRRIRDEVYDRIKTFGKTHEVTVNTIITTAFFRSMFELIKPPVGEEMGICVTLDLRKAFIGNPNQAICNLSVAMYPRIYRIEDEPFLETLKRVSGSIEELKSNRAGLPDALALEALWNNVDFSQALGQMQALVQWLNETGKSYPFLSNMGIIEPLKFGQTVAADAYLVAPTACAPGFMLAVSTYHRTLTLEVSYYEPAHRREDITAFIDLMEKELRSL